jgi:hypothetical protein
MTEVEVNGLSRGELDVTATKEALSSSSTTLRLGHLHILEERLSGDGMRKLLQS